VEDSVKANVYCRHALADSNYDIQTREKTDTGVLLKGVIYTTANSIDSALMITIIKISPIRDWWSTLRN